MQIYTVRRPLMPVQDIGHEGRAARSMEMSMSFLDRHLLRDLGAVILSAWRTTKSSRRTVLEQSIDAPSTETPGGRSPGALFKIRGDNRPAGARTLATRAALKCPYRQLVARAVGTRGSAPMLGRSQTSTRAQPKKGILPSST
jgi:hypothetical protein